MPTNFPTDLDGSDALPDAATLTAETLDTFPHSLWSDNVGAAIMALEAKVGIDSSDVTTSLDYLVANPSITLDQIAPIAGNTMLGNNTADLESPVEMDSDDVLAFLGLSNISSPIGITDGGTGAATQQAALDALAGVTTNHQVLAGNGTHVTLRALTTGDLPTGTGSSAVPVGGVITAAGPVGDAAHTPVLTYNAAGQLTTVTNTAIAIANTAVSGLGTSSTHASTDFVNVSGNDTDTGQAVAGPIQHTSSRSYASTPPANFGGTPLYVKQDLTLTANSGGGSVGPLYSTAYTGPSGGGSGTLPAMTGPRAVFTLEGTTSLSTSAGLEGVPLALQIFNVIKNANGSAVNVGSGYSVGVDTQILADNATVGWSTGDYPNLAGGGLVPTKSFTGYAEGTYYGTINSGVASWSAANHIGFNSIPFFHGNVSFGTVVNFFANELFIDGDGTHTPTVTNHYGFYMQPASLATHQIGVFLDGSTGAAAGGSSTWGVYDRTAGSYFGGVLQVQGAVTLQPGNVTNTATVQQINQVNTITWATTSSMTNGVLNYGPTHNWQVAPNAIGMDTVFVNVAIYKNDSAASINLAPVQTFIASFTKEIDTVTGKNLRSDVDFVSQPTYTTVSTGTYTSGNHTGFSAGLTATTASAACTLTSDTGFNYGLTVGASTTVTTAKGVNIAAPTITGAITTLVGVDIAQMTGATTSIGLRNAGSTVLTPSTVTVTSNAGTVPVTVSNAKLTNSSAATITVTMATTNAVDGQITHVRIYDFSAASQTLTWVNTENGKNTAPTTTNGNTTLPTYAAFMFNSASTKWTCIAV